LFEARAKCRDCLHESDCRNWWLESSEALRLALNFCPNANFFRACKREDHRLSHDPPSPAVGGTPVGKPKLPNVSFEQRASSEPAKLVWKRRCGYQLDTSKNAG
jgi:hypothetical protein